MMPVQVVGLGLDGAQGLSPALQGLVASAKLLVGSDRHLAYFLDHPAQRLSLSDFHSALAAIVQAAEAGVSPIVVLTSGDPLFFGFGRVLLSHLSPEQVAFHPQVSSMQLAFSRIKVPWQDARLVSVHGRSLEALTQALQQGAEKLAVLTDPTNSPGAIARLLTSLDLPWQYDLWVAESLGGEDERVQQWPLAAAQQTTFAPLNVVILLRQSQAPALPTALPLLGIPDVYFASFADRPGLMTKREVRVQALGELALPADTIWDIGAGTGSVAIEMARLGPASQVYAIEKTAAGVALIEDNARRFATPQVRAIAGRAPEALESLPDPDRVFIGGSGGQLQPILSVCRDRLRPGGRVVLALATLEHLAEVSAWSREQGWHQRCLQVQLARSTAIASLTRFTPLNPVTLVTLTRSESSPL